MIEINPLEHARTKSQIRRLKHTHFFSYNKFFKILLVSLNEVVQIGQPHLHANSKRIFKKLIPIILRIWISRIQSVNMFLRNRTETMEWLHILRSQLITLFYSCNKKISTVAHQLFKTMKFSFHLPSIFIKEENQF